MLEVPAHVVRDRIGGLVPARGIGLHRVLDDPPDRLGQIGPQHAGRDDVARAGAPDEPREVRGFTEWFHTRHGAVQKHAQRVHVAARVRSHAPRAEGFRRCITGCAGKAGHGRSGGRSAVGAQRGDAEVKHARRAVPRHQDVGGLDVAVDDPPLVRVGHAVAHRREGPQHRAQVGLEGVAGDAVRPAVEGRAVNPLHRDHLVPVDDLRGMNDHDVRVRKPRHGLDLAREAVGAAARSAKTRRADDLERHQTAGSRLPRFVHGACAPRPISSSSSYGPSFPSAGAGRWRAGRCRSRMRFPHPRGRTSGRCRCRRARRGRSHRRGAPPAV